MVKNFAIFVYLNFFVKGLFCNDSVDYWTMPYFWPNKSTRQNSANSVLTSNLVCFGEVTIRTTFSHMISFAGNLLKMPSTNVFNKLCVKITAKIYSERKLTGYVIWCSSHYASIYITTSYSGGIQWLPSPKAWQMLIRAPSLRATPLWEEPLTLS